MTDAEYDLVGVGIGPFNLGLAALLDEAPVDLDARFLEQNPEFNWHEDTLIAGTTLEVPFLADLVTMVDPTNRYSYLNYLHEVNRLYDFYFYEEFFIPRREYNAYCRWVADSLETLQFDRRVTDITERAGVFEVTTVHPGTGNQESYTAENVVVGIGTSPHVPEQFEDSLGGDVFHSASYLSHRERCLDAGSVTVVGSGQSAAEVFRDLLERQPDNAYSLDWITRSPGFYQMIDGKLGHMVYTPEYTDYFYDLPQDTKDELLGEQDLVYKGIDKGTSAKIYDLLYEQSIGATELDVGLLAATEVMAIGGVDSEPDTYQLLCEQYEEEERFVHTSDIVVLATGYCRDDPPFLAPLEDDIRRDELGRLSVTGDYRLRTDLDGRIFVQNAEMHTHGVNTPDLGLGPHRNAVILNRLAGTDVYDTSPAETFQSFTVSEFIAERGGRRLTESPPEAGRSN
ncbi:lysine N(6)-hydroxylase/L-ornithine N(5)-oxygenase family protein [Halalkalicoccus subterraneus]|uniref:lysine N(6)-hydroxylase/L-ornithine N(5)-oxygenase family protein n=1 Tax=Halalkalicoccus subterraneus TaxID=2675002 RepID=UPI000EFCA31B|nr:lysine N(6)-hydroxylase/L-ornithine N(5)-oxygenase family protein [Halalkalicoccus subterraneus]